VLIKPHFLADEPTQAAD